MKRTKNFVVVSSSHNGCTVTTNGVRRDVSFSCTEDRLFLEPFYCRVISDVLLSSNKGDISLVVPLLCYHRVHEAVLYKEQNKEISPNLVKPWMLLSGARNALYRHSLQTLATAVNNFRYQISVTTPEITLLSAGFAQYDNSVTVVRRNTIIPVSNGTPLLRLCPKTLSSVFAAKI